jgi:hypothetical protein
MTEGGSDQVGHGGVEVSGGRDDHGVLAAGLGVDAPPRVPRQEQLGGVPGAGEDDGVDVGVGDQPPTDVVLRAREEGEEVRWHPGLEDAVGEEATDRHGLGRGLEDDARAGGEGGQDPARRDRQREVPGRGHDGDPVRGEVEPLVTQGRDHAPGARVPPGEVDGLGDLGVGLAHGLARVVSHDRDRFAPAGAQHGGDPVQDLSADRLGFGGPPVRGGGHRRDGVVDQCPIDHLDLVPRHDGH